MKEVVVLEAQVADIQRLRTMCEMDVTCEGCGSRMVIRESEMSGDTLRHCPGCGRPYKLVNGFPKPAGST